MVLTSSPTVKLKPPFPTPSITPAASYPRPAGNIGDSTYLSLRHIESARLMPIALTLIRTSCGPGAGTSISMNSRTSGPPAFANFIVRDMTVSVVGTVSSSSILGGLSVRPVTVRLSFCTGMDVPKAPPVWGGRKNLFGAGQQAREAIAGTGVQPEG